MDPSPTSAPRPSSRAGFDALAPLTFLGWWQGLACNRPPGLAGIVLSLRLRGGLLAQRRYGLHGDLQRACRQRREAAAVLRPYRLPHHPHRQESGSRSSMGSLGLLNSIRYQACLRLSDPLGFRCRDDQRRPRRPTGRLARPQQPAFWFSQASSAPLCATGVWR